MASPTGMLALYAIALGGKRSNLISRQWDGFAQVAGKCMRLQLPDALVCPMSDAEYWRRVGPVPKRLTS